MKLKFNLMAVPAIIFSLAINAFALTFDKGQVTLDELKDYGMCQRRDYSGEFCQDALVRWVKAHPDDAFQAGKMSRKIMKASAAIPFFSQAFENKKGDCKDEDVRLAVVDALDLPPSEKEYLGPALKIGFELCFDEIKSLLLERATLTSYAFSNSCSRLMQKGVLTGLKLKKCQEITK